MVPGYLCLSQDGISDANFCHQSSFPALVMTMLSMQGAGSRCTFHCRHQHFLTAGFRPACRSTWPCRQPAPQVQHHHSFPKPKNGRLRVSSAASLPYTDLQPAKEAAAARAGHVRTTPADLPPPPKSASLVHVLPYLARLALADRQLYWRLGLAFLLMCLSKAAGGRD